MIRLAIVASHAVQYQAPLFRGLASRLDVTVFFCHRHDPEQERQAGYGQAFSWDVPVLEGYRHTWLDNVARRPGVNRFSGCDTPDIGRHLRDGRFDACLVHGWYLKSYLQAIAACRRLGIPVLLRGDSQLTTRRGLVKRALKYVPYRMLLNSVDGHLVVGSANREYLQHYGVPGDRLFDVPHAVDDAWFAPLAKQAREQGSRLRERAALGIPQGARVALFVGRLVASKRPGDLVRALAHPRLPDDVWGLFVGSGPLDEATRAQAASMNARAVFAGFRNQQALPACYAAADWLVLPSDSRETWGLVANEALACGLPVVVSTGAGCARDMAIPPAGRQYPAGNVDALVAAMTAVRDDLSRDPAGIEAAVRDLSQAFSRDRSVAAAIRAIESVAARRAPLPVSDGAMSGSNH